MINSSVSSGNMRRTSRIVRAVGQADVERHRVLKAHLDGRRLRLTDAQRRRVAVNGHRLGRKVLTEVATLVTPTTILAVASADHRA